jgi:tetratricopeptide (TPR) repeat protein
MHRSTPMLLALLLTATPLLTGCHKVQARAELKKGNALYANEEYREALQEFQKGLELDPAVTFAWRSVGLTSLALFKPGDESPENKQYADTAIDAFQKYLADYPDDDKVRDYLLSTFVNTKRYDDALTAIDRMAAQAENPETRTKLLGSKVSLLVQADRLDDAWKVAQAYTGPDKPELLYTVGQAYWNESFHATPETDPATRAQWVDTGMTALDESLRLKPQYFEAMVYKNLLFREKAKMETDAVKRDEYIAQAEEWTKKAVELRKQQKAEEERQKLKEQQEKAAKPATAS